MSATADTLRALAKTARDAADRRDTDRREQAAHVVKAAAGLETLRTRLGRRA